VAKLENQVRGSSDKGLGTFPLEQMKPGQKQCIEQNASLRKLGRPETRIQKRMSREKRPKKRGVKRIRATRQVLVRSTSGTTGFPVGVLGGTSAVSTPKNGYRPTTWAESNKVHQKLDNGFVA